jgi:hypothetical protein
MSGGVAEVAGEIPSPRADRAISLKTAGARRGIRGNKTLLRNISYSKSRKMLEFHFRTGSANVFKHGLVSELPPWNNDDRAYLYHGST